MAARLVEKYRTTHDILTVFANTGQEHERTLRFVDNVDCAYGLNVVWIETLVHHGTRKSCTFTVTDFANATRNGRLFEEVVKKYGIPNMNFPHCTRELKKC